MKLPRLYKQPAYERRLIALAEQIVGLPYVWGHTDCASLALRAIETMAKRPGSVAERLGVEWYDSRTSALRVFSELGGIRAALDSLGMTTHPVCYAHQGDIVVLPGAAGHPVESAGVMVSGRMITSTEELGVYWRPLPTTDAIGMRL